jgi:hypothetical protein
MEAFNGLQFNQKFKILVNCRAAYIRVDSFNSSINFIKGGMGVSQLF